MGARKSYGITFAVPDNCLTAAMESEQGRLRHSGILMLGKIGDNLQSQGETARELGGAKGAEASLLLKFSDSSSLIILLFARRESTKSVCCQMLIYSHVGTLKRLLSGASRTWLAEVLLEVDFKKFKDDLQAAIVAQFGYVDLEWSEQ